MKILQEEYKKLKYVISYPNGYEKGKAYPVIFHTHGAGSRGTDLKTLNIDVPICNNPSADDFIIVAPQCYADTWFEIFEQLIEFCEYIYEQPFTDKTRFYSSGISMGGYTAYQLMMSRPQLFAAGIVCCGGGMYWNASRLKDIPLRIFHGAKDPVVFPCESEYMADSIKVCGGHATLKIYPECDHNCWDNVYSNKENFEWLLTKEIKMNNLQKTIRKLSENGILGNVYVRVGTSDKNLIDYAYSKEGRIDEKTLFDMASVTKIVVTTSLALIAVDKGWISIEDPVSKYFENARIEWTIKHLLTHTIGIGHKALNISGNTRENVQEYIFKIPLDKPVGEEVLYSCPGFILLARVLEKVYGKSLEAAFEEYVAKPLNLRFTCFLPRERNNVVNANLDEKLKGVVNDYNCQFLGGVLGNAGLFSNIEDMTKYALSLLKGLQELIRPETFALAKCNFTENMGESRGLGFLYVDKRYPQTGKLFSEGSIGHCGHTGQSVFVDFEKNLYVIILSDATVSTIKKYGCEHYDEVMQMREDIHNAIKRDLEGENKNAF